MYISTKHQTDICTRLTLGLAGYADFAWIGGKIANSSLKPKNPSRRIAGERRFSGRWHNDT